MTKAPKRRSQDQSSGHKRSSARQSAALVAALLSAGVAACVLAEQPPAGEVSRPAAEQIAERRAVHPPAARPAVTPKSLREVLHTRLERAERSGRTGDLDDLASLWLTLQQREQLDRVVANGEGFINVALRNQRCSQARREAARPKLIGLDPQDLARLHEVSSGGAEPPAAAGSPDQLVAAEQLLDRLDEPYQTAVRLSLTGLNRREVSERMGVSHAAVRKWLERLRHRWPAHSS